MTEYATQFGLEEDEPMVIDTVYISSDESDSTPCSSPEHYFLAHSSDEDNAINQLKIIQREETVDGTQPPLLTEHLMPNHSTNHFRLTRLLLIGQVGRKDPQKDCCTAILSALTQSNFATNSHLFLNHQNRHLAGIPNSYQLVQYTPL